jgi:hypothetical protein
MIQPSPVDLTESPAILVAQLGAVVRHNSLNIWSKAIIATITTHDIEITDHIHLDDRLPEGGSG